MSRFENQTKSKLRPRRRHVISKRGRFYYMKRIFLLIVLLTGLYYTSRIMLVWDTPNSDIDTRVNFTVKPGSSLNSIANQLEEKGLIRDPWVFKIFTKHNDLETKLQAGDYVLQKNLTYAEITEILQTGKSEEIRITIPEGYTIAQIDELLTRKSLIEAGDFIECAATCDLGFQVDNLEGYLFPSTYYEPYNTFSSKKFIQRLYNTFQQQIGPFRSDIQKSDRSLNEIIIVASMIEREAFGDDLEEKKLISDVIWKRIDENWQLGIDATTRYETNNWKNPILKSDLEKDTPYNTRLNRGLPPTAISNPSLASIEAAVYPKANEYYYYLHGNDGQVHFAITYEEHNQNKAKYIY